MSTNRGHNGNKNAKVELRKKKKEKNKEHFQKHNLLKCLKTGKNKNKQVSVKHDS